MAGGIKVEITGVKELMATFMQLRGRARGQIIKTVVKKTVRANVVPDIVSNLEDVGAVDTGALRAAIRKRGAKVEKVTGSYARAAAGWPKGAAHGIFVEFGFTDRAGVHHPARPFLRPALYSNKGQITNDVADGFWKELRKVKPK